VACCRLTSSHVPGGTEELDGKSISRYLHRDSNPCLPNRSQECLPSEPRTWWIKYPWSCGSRIVLRWQNSGFAKSIRGVFLVLSCAVYRYRWFMPLFLILYIISFLGGSLVICDINFNLSRLV
jgi:hypothetical protein